jgi:rhodanese-related sulfurtransferase
MQQVASDIERYGLLVVFLNVLLAEAGLPLPAFPILITAAALMTESRHQVPEIILAGVSGSLILDVRPKEIREQEGIIPGAIPARPEDMGALVITFSHDLEIIVYCACPNEASAAIAATHLKQAGFKKIRPLLGGIDAWVQAGQPLDRERSSASTAQSNART